MLSAFTPGEGRTAAAALGAALVCFFVPEARAEGTDVEVRIEVRAQIVGRCGFSASPGDAMRDLRIDVAQTITLPFVVDCNEPFRIGVESAHGAVLRQDGASASGFRTARTYETELRVETDSGTMTPGACSSSSLAASAPTLCAFAQGNAEGGVASGEGIAIDRPAELIVRWPDADQDGPRFAPGRYSDVITIRLSRSL